MESDEIRAESVGTVAMMSRSKLDQNQRILRSSVADIAAGCAFETFADHPKDFREETWPFPAILPVVLVILVLLPETMLWLPRQFGYQGVRTRRPARLLFRFCAERP